MAQFSLDDIREAAEAKYADVEITFGKDDSVSFINALRLSKKDRGALLKLQEELGKDGADQASLLAGGLRTVASDKDAANRMLELVGEDLSILASIFEKYTEGTQAGEA